MATVSSVGAPLPEVFSAELNVDRDQLGSYLDAVGGGHPVHSSMEVATAAGFSGIPLPGVQLVGAALAACTRQLGALPIQLLRVESAFLRPVYAGDDLVLNVQMLSSHSNTAGTHVTASYEGTASSRDGTPAFSIQFVLRAPVG